MRVIGRHALKNALLPVLTVSGYQFARLLGGVIIVESIFVVPGMGTLLIDSIIHRDFIVLQAIVLLIAAVVLILNLMVDLSYGCSIQSPVPVTRWRARRDDGGPGDGGREPHSRDSHESPARAAPWIAVARFARRKPWAPGGPHRPGAGRDGSSGSSDLAVRSAPDHQRGQQSDPCLCRAGGRPIPWGPTMWGETS